MVSEPGLGPGGKQEWVQAVSLQFFHHLRWRFLPCGLQCLTVPLYPQASRDYLSKLLIMQRVMLQQARGAPTGPHAEFKELLVDAATARLSMGDSGQAASCSPAAACALQLAEYLELTFRRCENGVRKWCE